MNRSRAFSAVLFSTVTLGAAVIAWACGGDYYITSLLRSGDAGITERPATRFATSIKKLLPQTDWKVAEPASYFHPHATKTAAACLLLLQEALLSGKEAGENPDDEAVIKALNEYATIRAAMVNISIYDAKKSERLSWAQAYIPVLQNHTGSKLDVSWKRVELTPEIVAEARTRLEENLFSPDVMIPLEFRLYLEGAIAWQKENPDVARTAWKKVLELPQGERKYQGIFAAYMLGVDAYQRSYAIAEKEAYLEMAPEVRKIFQSVREIAQKTKIDPCGLACSSLGQEARTWLGGRTCVPAVDDYSKAASLYLEQAAAGDGDAVFSLQLVIRRMMWRSQEEMVSVAKDPVLRSLMSAYVLSDGGPWIFGPSKEQARKWISAMEASGAVNDAEAAQLAIMCYQHGDYVSCSRWLQKVPASEPLCGWLSARLLLREGKTKEAAAVMAKTVRDLSLKKSLGPVNTDTEYIPVSPWRYDSELFLDDSGLSFRSRIVAEQGVLAMTTKDYTDALDAFLRCGLDEDAAYVAEYVLSANELKAYVDATWPPESIGLSEGNGTYIRHLLGKRLLRERRWQESKAYFHPSVHETFDQYVAHVQQGYNTSLDFEKRAAGFWLAAALVREKGNAFFLAEVGPHWGYSSGWEDYPVPAPARINHEKPCLTQPTYDEISRVRSRYIGKADRDVRYRAAELAEFAAALLPNNDERTSRILATTGAWLKYREPRAADPFYKMLVIRCPDTPLGKAADKLHWFPPEVTGAIAGVWDDAPIVEKKDSRAVEEPVSSVELSSEESTSAE
ncbi:MAG: hypothetical protein LBV12_07480 [Puniceicoccales bacterium]|jgi:hypothetical protein|nr:hypothetical protein [Puniceicoccales bacterium]